VTNKEVEAMKDPKVLHRCRAEGRLLLKLNHPNIVKCFGMVESGSILAVVLSCEAGKSLAHVVTTDGAMAERRAAPIILQVARALRYCHQRKICHRDIKLENVVLDNASGRAVLVDFGLALAVRTQGGSRLDVKCGSHEYMAPELIDASSKGYYGPAVDMWALGVLAYALCCGQFPFGTAQTKICRGQFAKPPLDARQVSTAGREWIASALEVDPNSVQKVNRLSSADACKHGWLRAHEAEVDAIASIVGASAAASVEADGALAEAVRDLQSQVEASDGSEGADRTGTEADTAPTSSMASEDRVMVVRPVGIGPNDECGETADAEGSAAAGAFDLEAEARMKLLALSETTPHGALDSQIGA
jgi:serine/threonine protein kinase